MLEPGLDRHEWESQWQALEEQVEDSPAEALPELDSLVAEMLEGAWLCTRGAGRTRRRRTRDRGGVPRGA